MQGSIVPAVTSKIFVAAFVGVLACLVHVTDIFGSRVENAFKFGFAPFTALGVAISLFLGFHNNASYSRWWEARGYWGRQVVIMRDLTRFLIGNLGKHTSNCHREVDIINEEKDEEKGEIDEEEQHQKHFEYSWKSDIVLLAIAQTHAMRAQLRPVCVMDGPITAIHDRDKFLNLLDANHHHHRQQEQHHDTLQQTISKKVNPANSILFEASKLLGRAHTLNLIDTYTMIHIQKILDDLCAIQTSCERIHNTTIPLAYSLLVHRATFLYVFLVPFAIADSMHWWTPVVTAIIAYTFFGLDELARQIQQPFGDEPMCLALSAMSRVIEIDSMEALGRETRESLKPRKSILM